MKFAPKVHDPNVLVLHIQLPEYRHCSASGTLLCLLQLTETKISGCYIIQREEKAHYIKGGI